MSWSRVAVGLPRPVASLSAMLALLRSPAALSLVVLVLQNSALVVMTKVSKQRVTAHVASLAAEAAEGTATTSTPSSLPSHLPPAAAYAPYHTSTLVLNQEILKLILCLCLFAREWRGLREKRLLAENGGGGGSGGGITMGAGVSVGSAPGVSSDSTVTLVSGGGQLLGGASVREVSKKGHNFSVGDSGGGGSSSHIVHHTAAAHQQQQLNSFCARICVGPPSSAATHRGAGGGMGVAASVAGFCSELRYQVVQRDTLKLLVPAALFTMQNYLLFVALTYLDAMTFQMLSQSKLISAALLSVLLLGRRISRGQWVSLCLLTLGVYLSQGYQSATIAAGRSPHPPTFPPPHLPPLPPTTTEHSPIGDLVNGLVEGALALAGIPNPLPLLPPTTPTTTTTTEPPTTTAVESLVFGVSSFFGGGGEVLLGALACLLSGVSSSFAGVYFEKVVKTTPPSLAVRNIHLSIFAIPLAFASLMVIDVLPAWSAASASAEEERHAMLLHSSPPSVSPSPQPPVAFDYWQGYDALTYALVVVHAIGGLLVAVVVKYADNILKGFATAVAVIVSGVYMAIFSGYHPSAWFVCGCSLVCAATVMYQVFEAGRPKR